MPNSFSFGGIRLDVNPQEGAATAATMPETPFQIAVLGDFSGRGSRGVIETGGELAARRPVAVDRDNFDEVMEQLAVELELPVAGRIRFGGLDDFHPDRLYTELEVFGKLRQAGAELESENAAPAAPSPEPPARQPELSLNGLLDAAVEATGGETPTRPRAARDDLRTWVDERIAPHLEPREDQKTAEWKALVQRTAAAQMRALLHFPTFQALEAAWRSLFFLVRRLETGALLKIHLLDVSRAELEADLGAVEDLRETGIYRLLAGAATDVPWAVVAGLYRFGPDDLSLLARLATVTGALRVPLLGEAEARLAGCESLARSPDAEDWTLEVSPAWRDFRRLPVARGVGLALPRFLLRLPYGEQSDPCEEFEFEEMAAVPEHEDYLWGNPAIAGALLLGEAFSAREWDFRPGDVLRIDGLPLPVYQRDGESVATPCAETLLSERTAERLLERGLMPLVSYRDSDAVRLLRFQSVAEPAAPLAAWWS